MAAMMVKVTARELIERLSSREPDEPVGYLFSAKDDIDTPEHQVLVLFEPIIYL
jgi:hypothetical protein